MKVLKKTTVVNISELNISFLFQLESLIKFLMQQKEQLVSFLCRRQPAMTNGKIAIRFSLESKFFFSKQARDRQQI